MSRKSKTPAIEPKSPQEVCDQIGRKKIYSRLGVTRGALSNAETGGKFPSAWYSIVSAMCRDAGMTCPMSLFSFREDAEAAQ